MTQHIVVLGGGLGGMSAAISLAKHPHFNVTLIEKNTHLGGKLNLLEKDGFSFDLGPSILTMPHLFEKLFTMHHKVMSDYVKITPVRPHWRNFFEDGTTIDLTAQIENMHHQDKVSKEDRDALIAYYHYAKKLYGFTEKTFFEHQSETQLGTTRHYNPLKIIPDSDYFSTMNEGVRRYVKNPYLIDILNFFAKYVGTNPYEAPAVLNLLPYIQWKYDLWYVPGGLFKLSLALQKLLQEVGVTVKTGVEVTGVQKDNQEIQALTLSNGETLAVDGVVSNMEVTPFYQKISKESPARIGSLVKKYPPAASGFALHLGINTEYPHLAHHNFFYSMNPQAHYQSLFNEPKLYDDPTIYLVAPKKSDPSVAPPGHEVIKILPHIPPLQNHKPFTPEDFKKYREAVLMKLERMGLKNLRKHIVSEELWTPQTIQETYYSTQGSIYGVNSIRKTNMGFKNKKQSAFYDNLYFVGGSVNPGGGMPMVVLSGQQVVDQMLKNKRFKPL
jgi:diapolycopene oxygenase